MPANAATFRSYPNPYFIETGTWHSDGVCAAIEAGFRDVRSVELSPALHQAARNRFASHPEVKLWLGSSADMLGEMLEDVIGSATFWLDAHFSGGVTALGPEVCSLLLELAVIGKHPVKNHTVLIDDLRLFGSAEFRIELEAVRQALRSINPVYQFTVAPSAMPGAGLGILVTT